jgi:hypothetical protein
MKRRSSSNTWCAKRGRCPGSYNDRRRNRLRFRMFDPACADAWRAAILSSTQFRNAERIMHGIGHCPMMPSLDHGRRRALKLLAGSSYGRTESALLAHGIHPAALIACSTPALRRRASKRYPRVSGRSMSHASRSRPKGGRRSMHRRFEDAARNLCCPCAAMIVR